MNGHLINLPLSPGGETLDTAPVRAEHLLARTIIETGAFGC
jgi:hypothetical protein